MNKNVQSKTLKGNITELTAIAPLVPDRERIEMLKKKLAAAQRKPPEDGPLKEMKTIHYARWVIIDEDTSNPRLLFTSNFDGQLEDYLGDFSDNDPHGLNAGFGDCVGWPGARPLGPFLDYVRKHQVETNFFHAAYPEATTKEVLRALDWKKKTDEFLADLEGLWGQRKSSPESLEEIEKATMKFVRKLEKPTVPK